MAMGGRLAVLLAGAATAALVLTAGTARAQDGARFSDEFASFDGGRWSEGDHALGRSYLDPANADVDGQNLRIKLPARSLEGARSPPGTPTGTAPTPPA